ncbi:conserved hypothetical protein [Deferribacter desulfuricans SSM1]|uniref:DUF554 domain-containing protein n=1 Tax=Deferribacter desulfuricans (strain DSM 14783 / JCM 11476 / NBRC 101012 / SSM1) TaxID=639282 RepID=D3P9A6_DEFDS|nr:DUF554 domain-containing protein [Deferribacter desulfuricans]BAI81296.1 conserved hypothetical protein [Deferribacter desulfuricans SSM1]
MITGTIVNTFTVAVGSIIGVTIGKNIKSEIKDSIMKGLGLAVVVLGIKMAFTDHDFLMALFAIVLGTLIGEIIDIEKMIENFAEYIKSKVKSDSGSFVLGFVSASVLFCVGSMTIVGAIKDGLNNDPSVLYVKSLLDGVTSIILASTFGIGVFFSIIVIFIYQGALSLIAFKLTFLLNDEIYINGISVVGGIIILGIGLNMLGITKIKTANMLPSLFFIPIIDVLYKLWG